MKSTIIGALIIRTGLVLAILLGAFASAGRVAAQNNVTQKDRQSRVVGSLYAVQGRVTVRGWEHDLVARNPSLARFNWSPITAARPCIIVFRQPGQKQSLRQYHYLKPHVLTSAEVQEIQQLKEQRAAAKFAHCDQASTSGRYKTTQADRPQSTMAVARYSSTDKVYPASYSYSSALTQAKVHGRLISEK
jgi:hypothetical protein